MTMGELQWERKIEPGKHPRTPSTLIVPARSLRILKRRLGERNHDLVDYLSLLLCEFSSRIQTNNEADNHSVKKRYQANGQNMKRLSLRPRNEDWQQLGILADSLRVSRCYLFILLLRIDAEVTKGDADAILTLAIAPAGTLKSLQIISKLYFVRNVYKRGLKINIAKTGPPKTVRN